MTIETPKNAPMVVQIAANTSGFTAAMEYAQTSFERFKAQILANPIARAAFERAQKQPLPVAGGRGTAYRARSRRRTRSHR